MCSKESRWRRFTADSVTEFTIVQSGIMKWQHDFRKTRDRQLHVVASLDYSLGCVGGEHYTSLPRGACYFLKSFGYNKLSEPPKIVNVSSQFTHHIECKEPKSRFND